MNPAASGTIVDFHPPMPGWFRRQMAHAIAARTKASIPRPLTPGDSGGTGGRGRERGALSEGAVVVTMTATVVAVLPTVAGFGETVQVASEGAPAQVKLTVPENAFVPPPTLKV